MKRTIKGRFKILTDTSSYWTKKRGSESFYFRNMLYEAFISTGIPGKVPLWIDVSQRKTHSSPMLAKKGLSPLELRST
jgi:hypothetical protein